MKHKVALVRGKFLNKYEMQTFEKLSSHFDLTAYGSLTSFHSSFAFPVVKLPSPMDIPNMPYKMQFLNRAFIDAHYLLGLEKRLQGFDIAHTAETYYHYTQQCLNAKKNGYVKKVIITVLENIPHNNEGIRGRASFKKRARLEADAIIALTSKAQDALIEEGADTRKITVIGSGIDTQRFHPIKKTSKGDIKILFVGRLEVYKGVFDILNAAESLLNDKDLKNTALSLLFVGAGTVENELRSFIKSRGLEQYIKIQKVPYNNIHKVYQNADIFVAPSHDTLTWQEQYGYMLLEAQASGLPIVTTDAGSIPEVVGDAAIVVKQKNIKALTKALENFIKSPKIRAEYAEKARRRALDVHDSNKVAQKIAEVYKSLL